jgi:uncharacterized membrane protein
MLTHFPVVLLLLAPGFAFFAAFTKQTTRRTLLISGISLMALGLGCLCAAFESGKVAALSVKEPETQNIVARHMEFASLALDCFTLAALLLALCILLCRLLRVRPSELSPVLPVSTVTFYVIGLLWLVNAAYNGERLVHQFGAGSIVGP